METELYNQKIHGEAVSAWWKSRGEGALPPDILPPVGAVSLDDDGKPAGVGFAYMPIGCKVAFLDWFAARPGMKASETRRHLRDVLFRLQSECRLLGIVHLFGSSAIGVMVREAVACGFSVVSTSNTHLAKRL